MKFCKLSSDADVEGDAECEKKEDNRYVDMDRQKRVVSTKLRRHFKVCLCPCSKCIAINSIEKENTRNRESASKWFSLWENKTYTVSDGHGFACNHISFRHESLKCTCPV